MLTLRTIWPTVFSAISLRDWIAPWQPSPNFMTLPQWLRLPMWLPAADYNFLPVMICVLSWMYFVSQFYDRVLIRIHDDPTKWYSKLHRQLSCLGGMFIALMPSVFMPLIFFAGVLLSFKLLRLAGLAGLLPIHRDRLRLDGSNMFWFNLLGLVASTGILWLFHAGPQTLYFPLSGTFAVLLTAISIHFARQTYIVGSAPSRFLAVMDSRG